MKSGRSVDAAFNVTEKWVSKAFTLSRVLTSLKCTWPVKPSGVRRGPTIEKKDENPTLPFNYKLHSPPSPSSMARASPPSDRCCPIQLPRLLTFHSKCSSFSAVDLYHDLSAHIQQRPEQSLSPNPSPRQPQSASPFTKESLQNRQAFGQIAYRLQNAPHQYAPPMVVMGAQPATTQSQYCYFPDEIPNSQNYEDLSSGDLTGHPSSYHMSPADLLHESQREDDNYSEPLAAYWQMLSQECQYTSSLVLDYRVDSTKKIYWPFISAW